MRPSRFTVALSLALTLLPTATFADDAAKLPPTTPPVEVPTVAEEVVPDENATPPVDLVFCIDVSGSMQGYMPLIKATIVSLIRRNMQKYPGHPIRLGLVRYGDGAKRYFVQNLSEDQPRFLQQLQDTQSDTVGMEFVGDVVRNSVRDLNWAKNAAARRIYVIGNETALQGPVSLEEAMTAAHEKSVIVSAAYCSSAMAGSQGDDLLDVGAWFGSEWNVKKSWINVAYLGGGEYMQIVAQKGNVLPTDHPLLAVAWEPGTALRFADYLTAAQIKASVDRMRMMRSMGVPGRAMPTGVGAVEPGVMHYYDQNPQSATYLVRL